MDESSKLGDKRQRRPSDTDEMGANTLSPSERPRPPSRLRLLSPSEDPPGRPAVTVSTAARTVLATKDAGATPDASDEQILGELETEYQCNSVEGIGRCFALLQFRVDGSLNKIRSDITEVKQRVSSLEDSAAWQEQETEDIKHKLIPGVEDMIHQLEEKQLQLDVWGRKWNLVIKGIDGKGGEDSSETTRKLRETLETKLNMAKETVENMTFQAVHRLKGGKPDRKNIIARWVNLEQRDAVLTAARRLPPGSGLSVLVDLPPDLATDRDDILRYRATLSQEEKKKTRVNYLKEAPFVMLRTEQGDRNASDARRELRNMPEKSRKPGHAAVK